MSVILNLEMPFPWFAWPGTVMTASPVNIPRRGEWLLCTSGFCFIRNPCRSITNKLWCYWTKTLLTVSFVLDPFFFLLWQQSCFVSTDLGEVVKDRAERDAVRHFQTYSYSNPFHFFFFHSFFFFLLSNMQEWLHNFSGTGCYSDTQLTLHAI